MTVPSFADLARIVATNWKSADKEAKDYCMEVARILKERHTELTKVGGINCLSTIDSGSPGPPGPNEEAKPRNADGETKDAELTEFGAVCCLPTMGTVSPGPNVQLPIRATHAFGDQPSQQYLSMHAPMGIFPFARDQDTMDSRDSRTWLMDMFREYQHYQAATIPNATASWGNDSLNRTTFNMQQTMPSGVIQETIRTASMQPMTCNPVSQTGTDHQDVQQEEIRVIMNASRRASISNMMSQPSRAPMPEGIHWFGGRPGLNNTRYSAPDRQNDIQELDVYDSNIFGICWSSMLQEAFSFHTIYGEDS